MISLTHFTYTMAQYQHQEVDGQSIELAQISVVIYELTCVCCVYVCLCVYFAILSHCSLIQLLSQIDNQQ